MKCAYPPCGREFEPDVSYRIYCSAKCRYAMKRQRERERWQHVALPKRPCPICKQTFQPVAPNQVCCCTAHAQERKRERARKHVRTEKEKARGRELARQRYRERRNGNVAVRHDERGYRAHHPEGCWKPYLAAILEQIT